MNIAELNFEISNVEQTNFKEKVGFGNTFKSTIIRGLETIDEVARIIQTGAKDVRLTLELVEIKLHEAKGEGLIEGVRRFQELGLSSEQANALMNQLRND